MALYSYQKAPIKFHTGESEVVKPKMTLAAAGDRILSTIRLRLKTVKPISLIIPFLFIVSGIGILYAQVKPYIVHFIQVKFSDSLNQEIVTLVPESYEELRAAYIADPGNQYFTSLLASSTPSETDLNFKGTFYLTIDKINIHNAPVTANVDSYNAQDYETALGKGLAHFKGTSLPGRSSGNVFIYGHSAAGDYADKHPEDVVTAFTRLNRLQLADEIKISFEGQEYTYVVKKIKEVSPSEVSILGSNGGNSLTLMTCSPPGLNIGRLIIVATKV